VDTDTQTLETGPAPAENPAPEGNPAPAGKSKKPHHATVARLRKAGWTLAHGAAGWVAYHENQPAVGTPPKPTPEEVVAGIDSGEIPVPPRLRRGSIVPKRYKDQYAAHDGLCGDELSFRLTEAVSAQDKEGRRIVDPAKLRAVAARNGIDIDARWGSRNVGQQRMNLGNVLRARQKRGEAVDI
jgi:hypothetical protein